MTKVKELPTPSLVEPTGQYHSQPVFKIPSPHEGLLTFTVDVVQEYANLALPDATDTTLTGTLHERIAQREYTKLRIDPLGYIKQVPDRLSTGPWALRVHPLEGVSDKPTMNVPTGTEDTPSYYMLYPLKGQPIPLYWLLDKYFSHRQCEAVEHIVRAGKKAGETYRDAIQSAIRSLEMELENYPKG